MNKEQLNAATEAMIKWIAHPAEFGKAPAKIECVGELDLHEMHYYIFKYKKSTRGKWLLGVCGGYEDDELKNCNHTFSKMEEYHEETAKEDAIALVEHVRECYMSVAKSFESINLTFTGFHAFLQGAGNVTLNGSDKDGGVGSLANNVHEVECIPCAPVNEEIVYQQIEKWNDEDEFTRCITTLETLPEDLRDYRASFLLARALENYAIIGDHEKEPPREDAIKALYRAIEILESVCEEGKDKAEWNMRMAYAYQYLDEQEEKAIPYARRWAELDPGDGDAKAVIRECKQEIEKRKKKAAKKKPSKAASGSTPFESFDFTGFWDDCDYALEEYICDPPSDELIAEIEAELGYKLPASYIWLMTQHNGGIPVNTCFPTDTPTSWADDHVAITGIFGIGKKKACSLCGELGSQFMIDEWEYPAIGVAICDCPSAGHDMIFLDYRECGPQGEPKVVHIDQELDYEITPLADSFEEFIRGLVHEDEFDENDD